MLKCAIIGATGYTGLELAKILLRHPNVELTALTTRQKEPVALRDLIPTLPEDIELQVRRHSFAEIRKKADLVFLCLPHTEAMEAAKRYLEAGKVVIDLSADFRLIQAKAYEIWYGVNHRARELLKKAVYGLPELNREKIKTADLIANPGCYPTSAILGLAPLLKSGAAEPDPIIINSASGVSGAGKKLGLYKQLYELDENFYAYKVNRHQHTPEIEQALSGVMGEPVSVTFVPHLLPVRRGILTTLYLERKKGVKVPDLADAFEKAYRAEPFVRILPPETFPQLRDVQETNFCDIGFHMDSQTGRIIVISAIDNLLKGASGQAVQNMNIRFGFSETEGLRKW